jgi:DNA-binding PucR family transcriptional regulator
MILAHLAAAGVRLSARRPGEAAFLIQDRVGGGSPHDAGPAQGGDSSTTDGAGLGALLAALGGLVGAVGVGGAHRGTAGAARSYLEARRAAAFAGRLARPVVRHDDLGLLALLAEEGDGRAMETLVDDWLGALLAHDAGRRHGLLPTLAAYLDAGAAQQATADALGIHVSTLKYRLGRIEAVTGRDLSAPDIRFQLQVALSARRTLSVLADR